MPNVSRISVSILTLAFLSFGTLLGMGASQHLDLAGVWRYQLDPLDLGINHQWHQDSLGSETLKLPGILAASGIGDAVDKDTPWIGAIIQPDLWFDEKYDALAGEDGYKVPFWLTPQKFYTGPAWYQREIHIPDDWVQDLLTLEFERCHWESKVWIDGVYLGSRNSLSTPHRFVLPSGIKPGKHVITVRVDNSYVIPVGINAHSVSDNTNGNWNGIIGSMTLSRNPPLSIGRVEVYSDISKALARISLSLENRTGNMVQGELMLVAESNNTAIQHRSKTLSNVIALEDEETTITVELDMGADFLYWSEWNPAVYQLKVRLISDQLKAEKKVSFGMREIATEGTQFTLNGEKIFLRGTLECSIFPIEGHPPTEYETWARIFRIVRAYGLNHVRFHSWCPPKAAFDAADNLGVYLMAEAGAWATQGLHLGDGEPLDRFVYEEGERMLNEFGNHPSFIMMAHGNEADGKNAPAFLNEYVTYFQSKDNRRLYTSAAGWPTAPANDFFSTLQARVQQWTDAGSTYYIEDNPPTSRFNYNAIMPNYAGPFVSHEIGQWCAYPDFKEIESYTGAYRAGYLELYRAELEQKGMLHQAEDFLYASGRLQVLCNKADIEAALRTKNMGGFQLLDLRDFTGQGVALVGVLNALWENKGYISEEEFRQFCGPTVLLAAIDSHVLTTEDSFDAAVLISHFDASPLPGSEVIWEVIDNAEAILLSGSVPFDTLYNGSGQHLGAINFKADLLPVASQYRLRLWLSDTEIENNWDFFVFPGLDESTTPPEKPPVEGSVHFASRLDASAEDVLLSGGTVWLDLSDSLHPDFEAKAGFTPVYWNTLTFNSQPIHTLGILCDPDHPMYASFPTEMHSNWQWWDSLTHCRAMILDHMPAVVPTLQMIDSYHSNRKLGLVIEGKYGAGKLLVSSIDFDANLENRPAARQLKASIMNYLISPDFAPVSELNRSQLMEMIRK